MRISLCLKKSSASRRRRKSNAVGIDQTIIDLGLRKKAYLLRVRRDSLKGKLVAQVLMTDRSLS